MKFLTLSTTGIFNAIRPSLFPPIEGKETTTFLLALTFHTPEITFLGDEQEDVDSGQAEYALERQRIRAFVKALCNENGKPIEELSTECINRLPEFIRYGTYNGEDLLDTPRTGTYELYSMYKSYQGQRLLFKKNRAPKDEAQYIYDHMLRYFMTTLFSPDGILGYLCGAYHVDTPLSATAVQQILEGVDRDSLPRFLTVSPIPNTYTMNEPTFINTEFLLIADALGAYMVQVMEGSTESEQLAALADDAFFQHIVEGVHKPFMYDSQLAKIAVYDESNRWIDKLVAAYLDNQYDEIRSILALRFPNYDDGVLGYVKNYQIGPLLDKLVQSLTKENLLVQLFPKAEHRKAYLDFILSYEDTVQSTIEEMLTNGIHPSDVYRQQDKASVLSLDIRLCCSFYCMLDACRHAINTHMYASILPIVDKLDEKLAKVQISATDTWQVEYIVKLSRISQWYRALAYAFTGNNEAEKILQDLMELQQKDPVNYHVSFGSIMSNLEESECAFSIEHLRYLLLQHYVETNNRLGYERYIKDMYPPLLDMEFDYYGQMHSLLDISKDTQGKNYSNIDFYLWLKALWTFHLDHIDKDLWNELTALWDTEEIRSLCYGSLEHIVCVKYMVKLAIHFGDIQRAKRYKQELDTAFETTISFWDDDDDGYKWWTFEYCIRAQINEELGNLDVAKELYHKAYLRASFGAAVWEQFENLHGDIWKVDMECFFSGPVLKFADWIKTHTVTYDTIEEYKTALAKYMTFIFE